MSKVNLNNEPEQGSAKENIPKISIPKLEAKLDKVYDFRLNVIENQVEVKEKSHSTYNAVNENSIYRELHHMSFPIGMNSLRYILGSNYIKEFNPVKQYFLDLEDRSTEDSTDHIFELISYLSVKELDFCDTAIKHWMVSAIRCVFESGEFNKTILVFFNTIQNSGKTSFARFFIPPALLKYSSQNSLAGKDGLVGLYSTFIQLLDEMAEMQKMNKQEFKSLVSLSYVAVRPPYGKTRIHRDRITSLIGTSDRQSFLPEDVGSARFIVIEIQQIDFSYSKNIEIDKLWTQAYRHYLNREYLELNHEFQLKIQEQNKRYMVGSSITETISSIMEPSDSKNGVFMQTKDILGYLYSHTSLKSISDRSISESLNNLRFQKVSRYLPERKYSVYGYFIRLMLLEEEKH